jgi:glycosyltransferase involved in cell wall biosynthesis
MKILLSAFACAPDRGSEPGIGWGVVQQVARKHQVWVITHFLNRCSLDEANKTRPSRPHVNFVFVHGPSLFPSFESSFWLQFPHYLLWQLAAYRIARRLHNRIGFDLVHHVTYGSSWLPTFMGMLGIPFVWSAGLKDSMPLRFLKAMSGRNKLQEIVRSVAMRTLGSATDYITASRASLILTSSHESLWKAPLPVQRFLVGGLPEEELEKLAILSSRPQNRTFRIISIGRLLGWKGFSLGLIAFARLQRKVPWSEYWLIGDGPERIHLERLATALKCRNKVRFLGWLSRSQVLNILPDADVLLHPSFHEQFGYVLLEGMAAGKPIICLDVAGPSLLVPEAGGYKVPVLNREQVVNDVSQALYELATDNKKRRNMGDFARHWATSRWNWDHIGENLLDLYDSVLSRERGTVGGNC